MITTEADKELILQALASFAEDQRKAAKSRKYVGSQFVAAREASRKRADQAELLMGEIEKKGIWI